MTRGRQRGGGLHSQEAKGKLESEEPRVQVKLEGLEVRDVTMMHHVIKISPFMASITALVIN
jgi:hypothetical protein